MAKTKRVPHSDVICLIGRQAAVIKRSAQSLPKGLKVYRQAVDVRTLIILPSTSSSFPMLALLSLLTLLPTLFALPTKGKRATAQKIRAGRDNLCLSIRGGSTPQDGTAVVSVSCDQASVWDISPGSGSVVLSGTSLALDAGSSPGNNGGLKVWTSYPGLYQQTLVCYNPSGHGGANVIDADGT
jgi:hypothetical protein